MGYLLGWVRLPGLQPSHSVVLNTPCWSVSYGTLSLPEKALMAVEPCGQISVLLFLNILLCVGSR